MARMNKARMNKAQMAMLATEFARRSNYVRQDPAVIRAWRQASDDTMKAGRSIGELFVEARASWYRAEMGNAANRPTAA